MNGVQNNVYIHSSPPKAITGSGALIRQWVKNGDLDKLENLVLEGQGARLLGLLESSQDSKVKSFLKSIPSYMAKVESIHDAVIRGSLKEAQSLIDKKKLASARDAVGRGIAHKAVLYNNRTIVEWLTKKYPETLNLKDNEGRSCLHYAAGSAGGEEMYDLLLGGGSNPDSVDLHGKKPLYYLEHPDELDIEGPVVTRGKKRRISPNQVPKRKMYNKFQVTAPSVTRAQIRIWIHEKDINKLENIVWSGNGDKLLLETTNNGRVRRFLDNVPHLLLRIKSIHSYSINNDLDSLKDMRERTEINEVFKAKDSHGLTPLHKAVGLGNRAIVEYLIYEIPDSINEVDKEGRTPLHYAAKDPNLYAFLLTAGADDSLVDNKGKPASYYKNQPGELDSRFMRHVPDAPRVSGELSGWERGVINNISTALKRPPSSAQLSSGSEKGGKYELDNVEIGSKELQFGEQIHFATPPPNSSKGSKVNSSQANSRTNSRIGQSSRAPSKIEKSQPPSRSVSRTEKVPSTQISRVNSRLSQSRSNSRIENESIEKQSSEFISPGDIAPEDDAFNYNLETAENLVQNIEEHIEKHIETPLKEVEAEVEKMEVEITNEISDFEKNIDESLVKMDDSKDINELLIEQTESNKIDEKIENLTNENEVIVINAEKENLVNENEVEVENIITEKEDIENEAIVNNDVIAEKENIEEKNELIEAKTEENEGEKMDIGEKDENISKEDELEGARIMRMEDIIAEERKEAEKEMSSNLKSKSNSSIASKSNKSSISSKNRDEKIVSNKKASSTGSVKNESPIQDTNKSSIEINGEREKIEKIDEVEEALKRGDMESLVEKILNGKGDELLNRKSENKEVQEFLQNVPAYMGKIASIHMSASKGNLRDLQSLLDRKRLALARDNLGRGPLHKAVLHNQQPVVRYLATNYPQSLKLCDWRGRTPLHFAATLPDSGALYKSLVNYGSDPNVKDNEGNTPGIYLRNRELLKHKDLVEEKELGEEEKNVERWERPRTPTEVSSDLLLSLDSFYTGTLLKKETLWRRAWKKLTQKEEDICTQELITTILTPTLFHHIKKRATWDGVTLLDILKFYPQFFIIAPNEESYSTFMQLFSKTILYKNGIREEDWEEIDGDSSTLDDYCQSVVIIHEEASAKTTEV